MPAAITHCLQCQRVLEQVKKEIPSFSVLREPFFWGAQGPDFFACHRFLPWWKGESLVEYGERLHADPPAATLSAMWKYAADSVCHPYIESRAETMRQADPSQDAGVYHNEVESALDLIILRYEQSALPYEFPLKRTVPHHPAAERSIARLFVSVLADLYGVRFSEERLLECLEDCRKIFSLLTDRTGLKKNLVRAVEGKKSHAISCHIRGMTEDGDDDYANTLLEAWRWPMESGEMRRDSFFDLYESSIERAALLIREAPDCRDFAALTGNIPFA